MMKMAIVAVAVTVIITAGCSDSKDAPELSLPADVCEVATASTGTNSNPSTETKYVLWDWCETSPDEALSARVENGLLDDDFEEAGNLELGGVVGTEFVRSDGRAILLAAGPFLAAEFGGIELPAVQDELRAASGELSKDALVLLLEPE